MFKFNCACEKSPFSGAIIGNSVIWASLMLAVAALVDGQASDTVRMLLFAGFMASQGLLVVAERRYKHAAAEMRDSDLPPLSR